jgi:hypothetical protein
LVNAPPPYGALGNPSGGYDGGYDSRYDAGYDGGWSQATPVRSQSVSAPAQYAEPAYEPTRAPRLDPRVDERAQRPANERGLAGWAALLVLLVIAGIGGIIDTISGAQVRGGFNIGIVVASIVAILAVRRSAMFPIVIAPPIVYSVASGMMLYVRSGGLHDRRQLYDAASNWLVYGFPAIAAATAAVLIIAGIRMIARR